MNLVMLLNYAELVLAVTAHRYNDSSPASFRIGLYGLPRQRSRAIRTWLVENFELKLDPPVDDGHSDRSRLPALMLQSLCGQACTLLKAVQQRRKIGVFGAYRMKGDKEVEIKPSEVFEAIKDDLKNFPGFSMPQSLLDNPPASYCWPAAPESSRYVLTRI